LRPTPFIAGLAPFQDAGQRERKYRGNLAALMLHRPSSISDLALPCM
jgi:hypothetical protein